MKLDDHDFSTPLTVDLDADQYLTVRVVETIESAHKWEAPV